MKSTLLLICLFISLGAAAQGAATPTGLVDKTTNCVLRYYYFPNLEAYFDTRKSVYLYNDKGKWITAKELPVGYRGYSLYNKVSTLIRDYDDEDPTQFIAIHKKRYPYVRNAKTRDAIMNLDNNLDTANN